MNRALALLAPAVAVLLLAGCSPTKEKCLSPMIECGGKCVDGSRDPNNCGGCGTTCDAGKTCCGTCTNVAEDRDNCGACGAQCPIGGNCSSSTCSCPPATTKCGTNPGKCADLDTDPVYCGTCTQACFSPLLVSTTDATCSGGACLCSGSATSCPGKSPECRNTQTDAGACGASCLTCPPHGVCSSGICACNASGAFPNDCGATVGCVNFETDPNHCGGCSGPGTVCSGATPTCSHGHCCPSGQGFCGGACVDVRSSPTNCGTCGHACGAGQVCTNGACVCPSGQVGCSNGACCAGGCCGSGASTTCMTAHNNGLGQLFFDCTPSYTAATTTRVAASAAAQAFGATTSFDAQTLCGFPCVAGQKGGQCAIWCFGTDDLGHPNLSPLAGRVLLSSTPACSALSCPLDGTGFSLWPSP